jgi:hypothetical protein
MRSARELKRIFRDAGFADPSITALPLAVPPERGRTLALLIRAYNRIGTLPLIKDFLREFAPRLWVKAQR